MFGRGVKILSLFGFDVRIDASWIILAVLIVWSLASGLFPEFYEGLSTATYWAMGVLGALGLFASIIFHELCHSLVARRFGLPMKEITLFIFGGVASMEDEPPSAKAEFFMAVAGPLASILVAVIFAGLYAVGRIAGWPTAAVGIVAYVAWINGIVAAFNLLPAFPLDGGRILRSALWAWKKNLRQATDIASHAGGAFGFVLIALGVLSFLAGNLIGGAWWVLIGLFLRAASKMSYRQVVMRQTLEGEPVSRFMKTEPVSVPRHVSIEELVNEYIYKHHFKMFPVVDNDELVGCVTTQQVKEVPREEWDKQTVGSIAESCTGDNSIAPDADATEALQRMNTSGKSRLIVARNHHLEGIITLKDLLKFLSLKLDLEGGDAERIIPHEQRET